MGEHYSDNMQEYIDSVGGVCHASAVRIIERLEAENARLTAEVAKWHERAVQMETEVLAAAGRLVERSKQIDILTAEVAELRADTEEWKRQADYNQRKWADYEREYILPCFAWAEEMGIDLRKMVADKPGRNCVELLIAELRGQRDRSQKWIEEFQGEAATRALDWMAERERANAAEQQVVELRPDAEAWREHMATMRASLEDAKAGRGVDLDEYLKELESKEIAELKHLHATQLANANQQRERADAAESLLRKAVIERDTAWRLIKGELKDVTE